MKNQLSTLNQGDGADAHANLSFVHNKYKTKISSTALLVIVVVLFLSWAAFFEIDQSIRASGNIIPSARTQIIQVADGGVLEDLLVTEGEHVVKGQVLAVLEKERANASVTETEAEVAALNIALIRATAEGNQSTPKYAAEFNAYTNFIDAEMELFNQRKKRLSDETASLQSQLDLAQEELQMNQNLMLTGDSSRLEVMRAQREVTDLQGRIDQARNRYLEEARKEVTQLEAKLEVARHQLKSKRDVLEHTEVVASATGIIKYQTLNTIGGVLKAGDEIMQISPTDGQMVVELKIDPADVGELELGLPAKINFAAFDTSIYGSVDGQLHYISSDTLSERGLDGRQQTYYSAQVMINPDYKTVNPKFSQVILKPGMTAEVNIKTARRTVLNYLIKPINRAFSGAMSER